MPDRSDRQTQAWGARFDRARAVSSGWSLFFLVPFLIVFKISLSQTAIAQPPYAPVFDLAAGLEGLRHFFAALSFDNYTPHRLGLALSRLLSQEPARSQRSPRCSCC